MGQVVAIDIPRDQHTPHGRDMARDPGLSMHELERILTDMREEPAWRREADRCCDYYDTKQLTAQQRADIEARGMAPVVTNLIKPVVDVVLGMEAKTRTDWRVVADDEENQEVAEAESAMLHEAERESRADRACSDGYASQIKSGIGWVEVSRQSDPFKYPHRVSHVHRREIWWDWRDQSPGLETAKYLVRRRWFDWDQAAAYFPKHKDLLWASQAHWADWTPKLLEGSPMAANWEEERSTTIEEFEWRDSIRKRVTIFEVWYRVVMTGLCIRLPAGNAVEFNPKNAVHALAVARGITQPFKAVFSRVRGSFWIGPHRVEDWDTGADEFPYVPFWGHREDLTGVPYGVIRAMLDPQDEVNARRSKMLWLLSAKRIQIDSDAVDTRYNTLKQIAEEIGRPDAMIVLRPDRKNGPQAFKVDDQVDLGQQQFNVMLESKRAIQETGGVFQQMLGDAKGGANSGVAINSLVEQGMTTLAEINDNYRFARRMVGEKLHKQVRADMAGKQVAIAIDKLGQKKTIILNKPVQDKTTGYLVLENDTSRAKVRVALEDVPQTPAYKAQMQQMIGEVMKSLPEQLQAIMAPHWVESTDLKDRHEISNQMRKALNMVDPERMTPEERQAAAEAAAMQKRAMALELSERESKVAMNNAQAAKVRFEAMPRGEDQAKAQFEQKFAEAAKAAEEKITALTAELNQIKADKTVERENAKGERDSKIRMAEIERDKEIEVARVTAQANDVIREFRAEIQDMVGELADQIRMMAGNSPKKMAAGNTIVVDASGKGIDPSATAKAVGGEVQKQMSEVQKRTDQLQVQMKEVIGAVEKTAHAIERLADEEAKPAAPVQVVVKKQGDGSYVATKGPA